MTQWFKQTHLLVEETSSSGDKTHNCLDLAWCHWFKMVEAWWFCSQKIYRSIYIFTFEKKHVYHSLSLHDVVGGGAAAEGDWSSDWTSVMERRVSPRGLGRCVGQLFWLCCKFFFPFECALSVSSLLQFGVLLLLLCLYGFPPKNDLDEWLVLWSYRTRTGFGKLWC